MRSFTLLCFAILLCFPLAGQDTIRVVSKIDKVTVYREGAQVHRSARAAIPEGRTVLVFSGLPVKLVEQSLRVELASSEVTVVGVRYRRHYPALRVESPGVRENRDRLALLSRSERILQTELEIGRQEEEVLVANRDLGGSASGLSAEDLEQGVRYHRERIAAIRRERLLINERLTAVQGSIDSVNLVYARLTQDSLGSVSGEAIVEITADLPLRDTFSLRYVVAAAGWDPTYDLRVTDTREPLILQYRARVRQASGEDWERVKLTLSTGDPSQPIAAPTLEVWSLAPGLRPPGYTPRESYGLSETDVRSVSGRVTDEEGTPLVGATILIKGTRVGTVTDMDGAYRLNIPPGSRTFQVSYTGFDNQSVPIRGSRMDIRLQEATAQLDEVVVVGYGGSDLIARLAGRANGVGVRGTQQAAAPTVPVSLSRRPTTLEYAIDLPYTIQSGGTYRSVDIRQRRLDVTYHHTAVPKLDDRVFLSALLPAWDSLDLIGGEMSVTVDGSYLGTTTLDPAHTGDTLTIDLGPDPAVVIERAVSERFTRSGGLLGGKQNVWRGWRITARNTKPVPINLVVVDQIPVSIDGDIDVDAELPRAASYRAETGLLRWEVSLAPGAQWSDEFGYRVRYSTSGTVYLE